MPREDDASPSPVPAWLEFWGKAQPGEQEGPRWHPIAYHLLDVAAVAEALLLARPLAARQLSRLLDLSLDDVRRLIVALAGLHDIGKFAPAFQAKAPEHWPARSLGQYSEIHAVRRPHTEDGFVIWDELLSDRLADRLWLNGAEELRILAPAVFGHHGRPVGGGFGRDSARYRFRAATESAVACAETILALLSPHPIASSSPDEDQVRIASWSVSGVLTVADWIGSKPECFPYQAPDADDSALTAYWASARERAARAIRVMGLVPCRARGDRPFSDISGIDDAPTPTQQWACTVPLPEGPALFVIEDMTGSGKTEAAQMLVHRLMTAGRATGAYWAMPTMATANAMYERQAKTIRALYAADDGQRPSLVLAHGQQRLYEGFRNTVLLGAADRPASTGTTTDDGELESSAACAAFLADDRRTALLADVGAGTVDQAILGVLPSRFNTIRLFGLANKVLVIDEAHAFDAYMSVEIQELLRFQAVLGGSAVVLSATLTRKQRRALAQAWSDGIAGGGRQFLRAAGAELASSAYPSASVVSGEMRVGEVALRSAPWSSRTVDVSLVHDVETALEHVLAARERGGAVAWVRNTVDDCLKAAERLRECGLEPLVFHARFAQGDRQAREGEVMRRFGKDASSEERRGQVLVATQVIEQSLDLDFDAMVSDMAPIDLLVQRAGRLWRHQARTDARRPPGLEMKLVVLSPVFATEPPRDWLGGEFAGTARVYDDAGVLWRTVRTLASEKRIEAPDGLRTLIESVYDSDEVPATLVERAQQAEGKRGAEAAAANYGVLKAPGGYCADAVAWVNDVRMPTRIGRPRTTVRLARATTDGLVEPWVRIDGSAWKSWALSEVSVSAFRVPPGTSPEPEFIDAVMRLREEWGRFEQEIPVVVLRQASKLEWTGLFVHPNGETRRIGYSTRLGLDFRGEER